jgi:hypothetical protein
MADHKGWQSRGYLPHFDSPETVQFVTFRLADSLPRHVIEALRLEDRPTARVDRELDAGQGACWLSRSDIAALVENALLHSTVIATTCWRGASCPITSMPCSSCSRAIVSDRSSIAGSRIPRTRQTTLSGAAERSGTTITSTATCTVSYVEQNPVKAGLVDISEKWP